MLRCASLHCPRHATAQVDEQDNNKPQPKRIRKDAEVCLMPVVYWSGSVCTPSLLYRRLLLPMQHWRTTTPGSSQHNRKQLSPLPSAGAWCLPMMMTTTTCSQPAHKEEAQVMGRLPLVGVVCYRRVSHAVAPTPCTQHHAHSTTGKRKPFTSIKSHQSDSSQTSRQGGRRWSIDHGCSGCACRF